MDALDSGDESDHEPIFMDMLEDICDGSQYHTSIKRRESSYKIHDRIKKRQSEWKGSLRDTLNMGKGLHKVFKTIVKEICQDNHLWENLVQQFLISFQNLETLLKLQNFQMK